MKKSHACKAGVRTLCLALALALSAPHAAAQTQDVPGRDVASIRRWLVENNPELRARALDAQAAAARVLPAGALPDPMVAVTLRDIDPERPWSTPGSMTGNLVQVRQTVPLWGKRGLARDVADLEAQAVGAERDAEVREALARAEAAYARYWEAGAAIAVIDRRMALLEQVEEIAGVRYAVGLAPQQDAIRAQVVRTGLRAERLEREAARAEAIAALNGLLGRPADAPLHTPAAPPELPVRANAEAVSAAAAIASHPMLAARESMARAAETSAELQRRARRPDVTVGVGAMQRGDGIESLEVMLEVEVPFQRAARREREREANLRAEAAALRESAARRDLEARVGAALAQWRSARERRRLAEGPLRVQSDANFRSALAGYQNGEVDFATVLDALDAWQDAELIRLAAQRDELIAAADVRAIEGTTP